MGKGKFGRLNCSVPWQVSEYVFEFKMHMPVPLFLITLTFIAPQILVEHLLCEHSFASAGHLKTYKDKQDTALNSESKLQLLKKGLRWSNIYEEM